MVAFERSHTQSIELALRRRREELLKEVQEVTGRDEDEPYRTLAGEAPDSGDESVAAALIDTDHAAVGRDLDEIKAIDAALERIAADQYGLCSACGDVIAPERLVAYPTAERCFVCQDHFEKTHRHDNWPLL